MSSSKSSSFCEASSLREVNPSAAAFGRQLIDCGGERRTRLCGITGGSSPDLFTRTRCTHPALPTRAFHPGDGTPLDSGGACVF